MRQRRACVLLGSAIAAFGFFAHPAFVRAATTTESSTGSIAAFAEDWWWSQQYNQDGRYGETSVAFSSAPTSVTAATLAIQAAYSQSAGSATLNVYVSTTQQITPTDANHNKGTYWYGNTGSLGTNVGSLTVTSSSTVQSLDVASYLAAHAAATYYIVIENTGVADVGVSSIKITATIGESSCGNGLCDSGETCKTCASDCACTSGQCCAPTSKNANTTGCVKSGKTTTTGRICCSGKSYTGMCCSDSACGSRTKYCSSHMCKTIPTPTKVGDRCVDENATIPAGICCEKKIHNGNCCNSSQCASGTRCVSYHCTAFLDVFYKRYYQSRVSYNGGTVKPSDAYEGLATFYRREAEEVDIPILTLGKFAKTLDTISDSTRSLLTLNFLGLAVNTYRFFDEMETWELEAPRPIQNTVLNTYSAGSLLLDAAGNFDKIKKALSQISSHVPTNTFLKKISARHIQLQKKILTQTEMKQLFIMDIADFAMDATLLEAVSSHMQYGVLDYLQKVQLATVANDVSKLYEKAEKKTLTQKEALALMALEREFWVAVIARCTNRITEEERIGGSAETIAGLTDIKLTAEGKLSAIDGRRKITATIYFGKDIFATGRSATARALITAQCLPR